MYVFVTTSWGKLIKFFFYYSHELRSSKQFVHAVIIHGYLQQQTKFDEPHNGCSYHLFIFSYQNERTQCVITLWCGQYDILNKMSMVFLMSLFSWQIG